GWAKRWFELLPGGSLSYSVSPGGIKRGSIHITMTMITIYPKQRTIHLDTGTTVYHLKALTKEDFDRWVELLRRQRAIFHRDKNTATSSKRRFTFRRGSNQHQQQLSITTGNNDSHAITTTNNNSDISSSPHQQNAMITSAILDQWIQSVQRIMEIRDRMEVEYNRQHHHWIKMEKQFRYGSRDYQNQVSEFGTPRSRSFYSYHSTSQSDLYYDAEEFELILDEDDDADLVQENEDTDDSSSIEGPTTTISSVIKRRKILPHPVAGKSVNLLGLLRKNIGKDLSTITMPISLNEPLNLLQRLCEELEYSELLDKANRMDDPLDRLMYVSAFAISGYASSQYRIGRKFWNPLLFETYECIRPDKGFKFISEKVSHRPNIMACHAESDNFTFWQSTEGSTKFWGKSMEFISEGTIHVTLPTSGDHFTYTKPSSHMRNMIFGTRYLEHLGQIKVINHKTGDYAVVHFKEARRQDGGDGYYYFGGGTQWERNEVEVLLYKNNKSMMQPVRKIVGKWSQSLSQDLGDQQYKLLWQAQPPTIDTPSDYYGFTQFCMELNEITAIEQDSLPVTDTRYRPDQRLFEQGKCHVDQAEKEKERVEIAQRERRNHFEAQGIMPTPIWFQQNEQDPSQWEYKGGYWEARASGQWPINIPTLW
ncbi:Oxysterol-binding protein-domain-containing protein, partial [Halteromyces radiatus]|uniref:Oxysterol-binding protein-domain-containing protein n=1 Tax=Halteromyces radiatus TaxID=101107 RepID=UPI002220758A